MSGDSFSGSFSSRAISSILLSVVSINAACSKRIAADLFQNERRISVIRRHIEKTLSAFQEAASRRALELFCQGAFYLPPTVFLISIFRRRATTRARRRDCEGVAECSISWRSIFLQRPLTSTCREGVQRSYKEYSLCPRRSIRITGRPRSSRPRRSSADRLASETQASR